MRRAGGFTLLEVLVASAMMVVLAGSLLACLHIAFKARDSATHSLEPMRKMEAAMSMLKDDLQCALCTQDGNSVLAVSFIGQNVGNAGARNDSLVFYSATSDLDADSGLGDVRKVEFACEQANDANGNVIVRRLTSNLLAAQIPEPRTETICRGVRSFELRYFDGLNWTDAWDSTAQDNIMPRAVEVTIELNSPAVGGGVRDGANYRLSRVVLVACGQGVLDPNTTSSTTTSGGIVR